MGIYGFLKLHGKERSRKRDWRSHLGIDRGTSPIAGGTITNCTNPQKLVQTQSSAVESLPERVGIVFPKIE